MKRLVECVPNFSEGRRIEVVERIVGAIEGIEGVRLLDAESDADHNRSVVTFVGEPEAVEEAAFHAIRTAAGLIDMNQHAGEHPRYGSDRRRTFCANQRRPYVMIVWKWRAGWARGSDRNSTFRSISTKRRPPCQSDTTWPTSGGGNMSASVRRSAV